MSWLAGRTAVMSDNDESNVHRIADDPSADRSAIGFDNLV